MPNYCLNTLMIRGEPELLERLADDLTRDARTIGNHDLDHEHGFSFTTFVPIPDHVTSGVEQRAHVGRDKSGAWRVARTLPRDPSTNAPQLDPTQDLTNVETRSYLTTRAGEIVPLEEAKERGLMSEYDWAISAWGTKWDALYPTVITDDIEDGELRIDFNSAWAPPTPVIHALQQRLAPLGIRAKMYSVEPGCAFQVFHDESGHVEELPYRDPDAFLSSDNVP